MFCFYDVIKLYLKNDLIIRITGEGGYYYENTYEKSDLCGCGKGTVPC